MDAVTLTILMRGIGMILLIFGGVTALYFGYRVFCSTGNGQQTATFKLLGLNATAKGSGAVIMITAAVWAYCGVQIAPSITMGNGDKVSSLVANNVPVTAPKLSIATNTAEADPSRIGKAELLKLFNDSVLAHQALTGPSAATIKGRPATIDGSGSIVEKADGTFSLSTTFRSVDKAVDVTYLAKKVGSVVTFTPASAKLDDRPVAVVPQAPESRQ